MEYVLDGHGDFTACSATSSNEEVLFGEKSLKFTTDPAGDIEGFMKQTIVLDIGTYTASCFVKNEGVMNTSGISIQNASYVQNIVTTNSSASNDGIWNSYVTFSVTQNNALVT
jgi:hypothetical protein